MLVTPIVTFIDFVTVVTVLIKPLQRVIFNRALLHCGRVMRLTALTQTTK